MPKLSSPPSVSIWLGGALCRVAGETSRKGRLAPQEVRTIQDALPDGHKSLGNGIRRASYTGTTLSAYLGGPLAALGAPHLDRNFLGLLEGAKIKLHASADPPIGDLLMEQRLERILNNA